MDVRLNFGLSIPKLSSTNEVKSDITTWVLDIRLNFGLSIPELSSSNNLDVRLNFNSVN